MVYRLEFRTTLRTFEFEKLRPFEESTRSLGGSYRYRRTVPLAYLAQSGAVAPNDEPGAVLSACAARLVRLTVRRVFQRLDIRRGVVPLYF